MDSFKHTNKHSFIVCLIFIIFIVSLLIFATTKTVNNFAHADEHTSSVQFNNNEPDIETDYITVSYPTNTIFQNQSFIVTFIVATSKTILNFDYQVTGFDVLAVSNDIYSVFEFELCASSNFSDYLLHVQIELSDDTVINQSFYALGNEYGLFFSEFSCDDATEKYIHYLYSSEIITELEFDSLRREIYIDSVIEENYTVSNDYSFVDRSQINREILFEFESSNTTNQTSSASITDATYVNGLLQWKDDAGELHPLRRIMVDIMDYDGIAPDILGTVYTNNEGRYSFTFDNADLLLEFENGGYDVYIKVYAGTTNAQVIKSNDNEYYYTSSTQANMNVTTGSTTVINMTFGMGSALGQAFQISQAVLTARDFAWNMSGSIPSDMTILYPAATEGCTYDRETLRMYIVPASKDGDYIKSYAAWDVIMHEYGHHIQYDMDITAGVEGTHFAYENDIDSNYNATHNKGVGIRLAWGES
ncbi:MAG: hypothetical protein LBE09_06635 [Christensenellaceae bacterium]|nr:hypothetical protein [Christensenellaceae bacterium]